MMLRGFPALLMIVAVMSAPGCLRRKKAQVETVEEYSKDMASVVHSADPASAVQLLKGFHDVEQNAWRWTKSQFSVTLRVPGGARTKGGKLELKFTLPEVVIHHTKSTTLSAKMNQWILEPQSYSQAGEHLYTREVPAEALQADAVTVDFSFDKFLAAGQVEMRELAAIVSTVALESK